MPLGNQPPGFQGAVEKTHSAKAKKNNSRKPSHFFHFSKFHLYTCTYIIYSFLMLNQAGLTDWFFLGESRSKSETGTSESPFFGLWNTLQRFPTYLDTAMDHMDQSNSPVVFRTGWAIKGLWIPNSTVQFDDSPDAKVEPTRETMSPWSGEETKSCSVPWMETFIEKNEFQFQLGTLAGIGAFFQKIRFFERFLRSGAWGNFPPLLKTTNHFWVRSRNFGSCHVGLGPVPWSPLPPKVHRAS